MSLALVRAASNCVGSAELFLLPILGPTGGAGN